MNNAVQPVRVQGLAKNTVNANLNRMAHGIAGKGFGAKQYRHLLKIEIIVLRHVAQMTDGFDALISLKLMADHHQSRPVLICQRKGFFLGVAGIERNNIKRSQCVMHKAGGLGAVIGI